MFSVEKLCQFSLFRFGSFNFVGLLSVVNGPGRGQLGLYIRVQFISFFFSSSSRNATIIMHVWLVSLRNVI